jgi:hypothetical protein
MMSKILEYRFQIMIAGYCIAILGMLGYIPTIDALKGNDSYIYVAAIAINAYVWYMHYHMRAVKANLLKKAGYHKTPYYDHTPQAQQQQVPQQAVFPTQGIGPSQSTPQRMVERRPAGDLLNQFEKGGE